MKRFLKKLLITVSVIAVVSPFVLVGLAMADTHIRQKRDENAAKAREASKVQITPDGLFLAFNDYRKAQGLPPYSRNPQLDTSAGLKCADMAKDQYYAHTNPTTGKNGYDYVKDVGLYYNNVSENMNAGNFYTPKEVIDDWMLSEPHRAAVLDPKYTEVGLSVCTVPSMPGQQVFVQHFIEPYIEPAQTQVIQQQPQYRTPTPTTTYCRYNDGGGYFSPTTTCNTY